MDKRLKARWVKALRSGKYLQGFGALKYQDENSDGELEGPMLYCCLGVLCEVAKIDLEANNDQSYLSKDFALEVGFLSKEDRDEHIEDDGTEIENKLAEFNDKKKWSFKKIASWIEKTKLF